MRLSIIAATLFAVASAAPFEDFLDKIAGSPINSSGSDDGLVRRQSNGECVNPAYSPCPGLDFCAKPNTICCPGTSFLFDRPMLMD